MAVELKKTLGIILRIREEGETTKMGIVFTRDSGKVNLIAKGARKPLSRLGYAMDIGNLVELVYYFKDDRNYHYISQITLVDQFQELKSELNRFKFLACVLELTDILTPLGEENRKIFNLLLTTLKLLRLQNYKPILYAYALKLLSIQGFKPELKQCVECGKMLGRDVSTFSIDRGGLVCHDCLSKIDSKALFELRPDLQKLVSRFIRSRLDGIKNVKLTPEQVRVIGDFVKVLVMKNSEISELKCANLF